MKTYKYVSKAVAVTLLVFSISMVGCDNNNTPIALLSDKQQNIALVKTEIAWKSIAGVSINADNQALNRDLNTLAKAVAKTLSNESIQKALHKKVMQRFDGETETLWNTLNSDQTMTNTLTNTLGSNTTINWTQMVAQSGQTFGMQSEYALQSLIQKSASSYFANVHLFWYNAEKWDGKTLPLVTFIPMGVDLEKEKITTLTAFDAEGNMYQVDKTFADNYPVIVIGPNERTRADGTLLDGIVLQSGKTDNSVQTHSVVNFQLDWLSFNSAKADEFFEGWFGGAPEFFVAISVVNPTSYALGFEYARWHFAGQIASWQCDGRVLGGWTGPFAKTLSWDTGYYRTFNFRWFERDPDQETEISLSFPFKIPLVPGSSNSGEIGITAGIKTKITQKDDILDVMTIDYSSPSRYFGAGLPYMQVIF